MLIHLRPDGMVCNMSGSVSEAPLYGQTVHSNYLKMFHDILRAKLNFIYINTSYHTSILLNVHTIKFHKNEDLLECHLHYG